MYSIRKSENMDRDVVGAAHLWSRRQTSSLPNNNTSIGIAAFVIFFLAIGITLLLIQRRRRQQKGLPPQYIPTSISNRWHQWRNTTPRTGGTTDAESLPMTETAYNGASVDDNTNNATVDRHASVRSVQTLPPYSHFPKDNERVLGREGERGGMDTVLEFPENADEEENRRETEAEELYQVRVARRREAAERDERRRERREARERGDSATLERLRRESLQRTRAETQANQTQAQSSASLLADIQARGRDRRVSEVNYASVGQVRHDGSRLRAHSNDSERGGLLTDAASMGRTRGASNASVMSSNADAASSRHQNRSDSPRSSISSRRSHERLTPESTIAGNIASQQESSGSTSNSSPTNRFTPLATPNADIGEEHLPGSGESSLPPDYDNVDWGDAPAYDDVVQARRAASNATTRGITRTRPSIRVPSISIHDASETSTPLASTQPATTAHSTL